MVQLHLGILVGGECKNHYSPLFIFNKEQIQKLQNYYWDKKTFVFISPKTSEVL